LILKDSQKAREEAARTIHLGGLVAFRTDTFYGLGADPFNREAVQKIRQLKGREDAKPILILISDAEQLEGYVNYSESYKLIAFRLWPAPLTLVGLGCPELPSELTAGTNTIGVRLPDDERVRALVRACGGALTATSANPSGQSPARTAEEVANYFPVGINLIVDGGEVTAAEPSTVVDLSGPQPRLIREGIIKMEQLTDILDGI
jgi:L-threonylcarbamoyladenylate synthase